MNYEAKVTDLSGAESVLIDDVELDGSRQKRRRILIALAIVVALLIGGGILYFGSGEEAPFPAQQGGQVPTVSVVAPGRTTVAGTINATGTLAARRAMPVGVVGEGGRVVSVLVEPGDWVRAGQTLAVIDRSVQTQQAQSSAAQIEVARAEAELAQANLDRALQLVDRGFISKADVDRLTATRSRARAPGCGSPRPSTASCSRAMRGSTSSRPPRAWCSIATSRSARCWAAARSRRSRSPAAARWSCSPTSTRTTWRC